MYKALFVTELWTTCPQVSLGLGRTFFIGGLLDLAPFILVSSHCELRSVHMSDSFPWQISHVRQFLIT